MRYEEAVLRGPNRRDFLYVTTGAVAGVAAAAALWPLATQMNPDASTLAAGGPVEVDVSKLAPGQQIVVRWRDRPVFIVRRTATRLDGLRNPRLVEQLLDASSRELQQPSYAVNWHRSINPEFLVVVGVCTHLGCIPTFFPEPNTVAPLDRWFGGYFCTCHGSKYDLAGRVFKGVPAPYNLPVPPYRFTSSNVIRIGENPEGTSFDFGSIRQI